MGLKVITKLELERLNGLHGKFKNVLDVGCGEQIYKSFINFDKYIGIDVQESGRSNLNKKVDKFFDGKSIPYPDNEFDFILCTEVLEHALEPIELIKEMKRVLKINGIILVTVPSMWGEHETPYDFRRYTSFGITKMAQDMKLEIIKFEKECPGVLSLIKLGLSEVNASNNKKIIKLIARFWLLVSYVVLGKFLKIEMPRIYLTNLVTFRKKINQSN